MVRYRRFIYLVLLVLAIVAPLILRDAYLRHLLVMSGIFAILALSLDIIMGYMGQFSFGHMAFFGVGGYASALLSLRLGLPVWLTMPLSAVIAGAFGLFVAYIALRRTRAMYLAIITLSFGIILWLIVVEWYEFTKGMTGLTGIPFLVIRIPFVPEIAFRSELSYYYLVLTLVLFTMYFISRLLRSRFGRSLISLRENEALGSSIGIDAFRHFVLAFTLATALAGLAGATYAHYMRIVTPAMFELSYMFMMLVMVIVGGTRALGGPVLGAIIFVFVPELLRIAAELRLILFGAVLLVCIVFMPQGVYGGLVSLWNSLIVQRDWAKRRLKGRSSE